MTFSTNENQKGDEAAPSFPELDDDLTIDEESADKVIGGFVNMGDR